MVDETIETYDAIAEDFVENWPLNQEQIQYLESFADRYNPEIVLDAGCGAGKDSNYLQEKGIRAVSLDLSEGMLNVAREKYGLSSTLRSDIRDLPLRDGSLDRIWNNSSLVHLSPEDKANALSEFYRTLTSGGGLHICHQNIEYPRYKNKVEEQGGGKDFWLEGRHFYPEDIDTLTRLVGEAGFEIEETNEPDERWLRLSATRI